MPEIWPGNSIQTISPTVILLQIVGSGIPSFANDPFHKGIVPASSFKRASGQSEPALNRASKMLGTSEPVLRQQQLAVHISRYILLTHGLRQLPATAYEKSKKREERAYDAINHNAKSRRGRGAGKISAT